MVKSRAVRCRTYLRIDPKINRLALESQAGDISGMAACVPVSALWVLRAWRSRVRPARWAAWCLGLLWAGHALCAPWQPVEAAAVPPLTPAQASAWPAAVAAEAQAPSRSLGVLLRLLHPKPGGVGPQWPPANAVRERVAEALAQTGPRVYRQVQATQFVEHPDTAAATDAVTDAIASALQEASHGPQAAPAERVADTTKGLLRALHDGQALKAARELAQARRQGATAAPRPAKPPLATLDDIDDVRVTEGPQQPATLWVRLRPDAAHPQGLVARVNLDGVLEQVSRRVP